MKYYKLVSGEILEALYTYDYEPNGIGNMTEITNAEYETLLAQIRAANPPEDEVPPEIALAEIVEVLEGANEQG